VWENTRKWRRGGDITVKRRIFEGFGISNFVSISSKGISLVLFS